MLSLVRTTQVLQHPGGARLSHLNGVGR